MVVANTALNTEMFGAVFRNHLIEMRQRLEQVTTGNIEKNFETTLDVEQLI